MVEKRVLDARTKSSTREQRRKRVTRKAIVAEERRGGGLRRMPDMLARVLDPAARRRGLADAGVLTEWAAIVGPHLAACCQPIKLGRDREGHAVLHLRVVGSAALELQHTEPQVLERVNGYFGYRAVERLRLVQAPVQRAHTPHQRLPRPLSPAERRRIDEAVTGIADPALRRALAGLGRALRSSAAPAGRA